MRGNLSINQSINPNCVECPRNIAVFGLFSHKPRVTLTSHFAPAMVTTLPAESVGGTKAGTDR